MKSVSGRPREKPEPRATGRFRQAALPALLVLLTVAVFHPVRDHDFTTIDDNAYVTENPTVGRGLTAEGLSWAFTSVGYVQNWHPLTWLSHMADVQLFGMDPGMHHLVSLLFHVLNTVLLFLVLRSVTGALWRSAAVAALFAVHPLHVESVAWIAERKDVLSTLFWLLAMWAYAQYARSASLLPYLLSLTAFALGILSKPMVVTLPFVLLLLDIWPLGRWRLPGLEAGAEPAPGAVRRPIRLLLAEKVPFFLLSAFSGVITFLAQSGGGAVSSLQVLPLSTRVSNAVVTYGRYVLKMFAPVKLSFFYPHPENTLATWEVGAAAAFLLLVTLLAALLRNRLPALLVGWLWFLGTLVPVIGVVQVGGQAMADRYTYIPLIGLFIMTAWGVADLLSRFRGRAWVAAGTGGAVLALALLAHAQVKVWKNSTTVLRHALDLDKSNWMAHFKLGELYDEQGRTAEAIRHYTAVLQVKPFFYQVNNNLGILYAEMGMTAQAVERFLVAARVAPREARIHFNLGNLYYRMADYRQSASHFIEALRLEPVLAEAYLGAGDAEARLGQVDGAIARYRDALRLRPGWPDALAGLGSQLFVKGDLQGALAALTQANRTAPGHPVALRYLRLVQERLRE